MSDLPTTLLPLVTKLQLWASLDSTEQAAILRLPHTVEEARPGRHLVREGDLPTHSCLLITGFAYRDKVLVNGGKSISAIHMPGDIVDLQNSLLGMADHNVRVLTPATVAFIPVKAIKKLAFEFPNVGMAMWYDTLVDGSIFREWIANIARRNASARLAHLLCEFGLRYEAIGLGRRDSFVLPMTQEQLADATGLTSVHINRTLMDLQSRGLIARDKKTVTIADWDATQKEAGFTDLYLHLGGHNDRLADAAVTAAAAGSSARQSA